MLKAPLTAAVDESRAQRQQRLQAKLRNRGGIFVPSERNTLIDILLSRSVTGESPSKAASLKQRLVKKSLPVRSNGIENTELVEQEEAVYKGAVRPARATTQKSKVKAKVVKQVEDIVEDDQRPVAGPSHDVAPIKPKSAGKTNKKKKKTARTDCLLEESKQIPPKPKAKGRALKAKAAPQVDSEIEDIFKHIVKLKGPAQTKEPSEPIALPDCPTKVSSKTERRTKKRQRKLDSDHETDAAARDPESDEDQPARKRSRAAPAKTNNSIKPTSLPTALKKKHASIESDDDDFFKLPPPAKKKKAVATTTRKRKAAPAPDPDDSDDSAIIIPIKKVANLAIAPTPTEEKVAESVAKEPLPLKAKSKPKEKFKFKATETQHSVGGNDVDLLPPNEAVHTIRNRPASEAKRGAAVDNGLPNTQDPPRKRVKANKPDDVSDGDEPVPARKPSKSSTKAPKRKVSYLKPSKSTACYKRPLETIDDDSDGDDAGGLLEGLKSKPMNAKPTRKRVKVSPTPESDEDSLVEPSQGTRGGKHKSYAAAAASAPKIVRGEVLLLEKVGIPKEAALSKGAKPALPKRKGPPSDILKRLKQRPPSSPRGETDSDPLDFLS